MRSIINKIYKSERTQQERVLYAVKSLTNLRVHTELNVLTALRLHCLQQLQDQFRLAQFDL
jgi:hypothetical protein